MFKNLGEVVRPRLSQLKLGTGPQLSIKKALKRWAEHLEKGLNGDKFVLNHVNNISDNLEAKDDLFWKKGLEMLLYIQHRLKNNKVSGDDRMVNERNYLRL